MAHLPQNLLLHDRPKIVKHKSAVKKSHGLLAIYCPHLFVNGQKKHTYGLSSYRTNGSVRPFQIGNGAAQRDSPQRRPGRGCPTGTMDRGRIHRKIDFSYTRNDVGTGKIDLVWNLSTFCEKNILEFQNGFCCKKNDFSTEKIDLV